MPPRPLFALLIAATLSVSLAPPVAAQSKRPSAMRLFPAETVLWVRTADARLLAERLRQTLTGQMLADPEMASVKEAVWGAAEDAYAKNVQELLDADLSDLMKLPAGEVAFGVVNRVTTDPALLLIADFGDRAQVARQVVDRLESLAQENAGVMTRKEQLRSDEATIIRDGNNQSRAIAIVQRENVFVICSDPVLLQVTLDRWDGLPVDAEGVAGLMATFGAALAPTDKAESTESTTVPAETVTVEETSAPYLQSLAENPTFAATFREVQPGSDEPPQLMAYADPVGAIQAFGGRQMGVRVAMATFPALGIDGVKGFGAAAWFATDTWDSLIRGHLLLSNPRSGVVKVARLETGVTDPPPFVPTGVENAMTLRVDPTRLFGDIVSLYDRFQFDGAFRKLVDKNMSGPLGLDFEKEVVANLDGTLCYITRPDNAASANERGLRVNFGSQPAFCFGVLDPDAARESLKKLADKFPGFMEEATLGQTGYYRLVPRPFRDMPPGERPFSPCVAVLDNTLVSCQSEAIFVSLIETRDGAEASLIESLQYRLVKSRLERLTEGRPFSAFGYHDSEPMLRHMHERATSPDARKRLDGMIERVGEDSFFGKVRGVLDESEMPPLETLLKYAAPSGSVMIDTDTGWHMISFTFKRQVE